MIVYTKIQVVFDAAEPAKLVEFWLLALDYVVEPPPRGFETWEEFARSAGIPEEEFGDVASLIDPADEGPRLYFQRVPEGKTAKNRSTSMSGWPAGKSAARRASGWSARRWSNWCRRAAASPGRPTLPGQRDRAARPGGQRVLRELTAAIDRGSPLPLCREHRPVISRRPVFTGEDRRGRNCVAVSYGERRAVRIATDHGGAISGP